MALINSTRYRFLRGLGISLVGLLAVLTLAACGSDQEVPADPPKANTSTAITEPQAEAPAQQLALETASAAPTTEEQPPETEPTPLPVVTPLVIKPSPTQPPALAPTEAPADTAPAIAIAPAGAPEQPEDRSTEAPTTGLVYTDIGPDTTWGDVYETFSDEEQACIRNAFGGVPIEPILEMPFNLEAMPPLAAHTVVDCVSDESAAQIAVAETSRQLGGITEEEASCLQELYKEIPISELTKAETGEPTPEAALLKMSYGLGLLNCLPKLADEAFAAAMQEGGDAGTLHEDPSHLWSFSTGGWVVTAPAVANGVVYIGSDDHSLYALDAQTGELRWSHATGDVVRSTPTVVDGRVYFGSNDNHLYALDAATGSELWKYDTGQWVQYSPVVGGGKVYFGAQSEGNRKVHAVDGATGEVIWVAEHPFPIGAEHSPTAAGDRVYAQGAEFGEFYALDAGTGEVAWQADVVSYVESGPTLIGEIVYLTVVNQAYALNKATGEIIWSINTDEFPARDFPALVVDGIYYLAPSETVYALDAASGEELWSYESGMLSTAPVVADGKLFGASGDAGTIFALDAAKGWELWKEPTDGEAIHSLTVADGRILGETSAGFLVAAGVDDGVPFWGVQKGGFSDVQGYTVHEGIIYYAGPNNSVYAHPAP